MCSPWGNHLGFPLRHHCHPSQGITGEHGVWEQAAAQRKAAAQCEAAETSINHSPNWFPTCVRCLPRNSHTTSCPGVENHHDHGAHPQSCVVDIKPQQCVEQTTPLRQKLMFCHRTYDVPRWRTHSCTNSCFAHTLSNNTAINLIRLRLSTISSFKRTLWWQPNQKPEIN